MADLGSIGTAGGQSAHYFIALDTAWARSAKDNVPTCYSRGMVDAFSVPRFRDQWRRVSGTVKNSAGTGIARRVLAIDNRTGAVRGHTTSASDGTFTMPIACTLEAVTVIAIPNAGDSRNVVAYDAVVPVT